MAKKKIPTNKMLNTVMIFIFKVWEGTKATKLHSLELEIFCNIVDFFKKSWGG